MPGKGERRSLHMGIVAVVVAVSACASGSKPDVPPAAPPPSVAKVPVAPHATLGDPPLPAGEVVIARVDGQPIHSAEAFRLLFLSAPNEVASAVQRLVVDRLCLAEAQRLGASVTTEAVDRELAKQLAEQERKIKEATKGRSDLAGYVKATYAMELPEYTALVRASFERSLLLERVILYEMSLHPRTQIRVIRVKDKTLAGDLRAKLALGADFAVLARQNSEDGSARDGGVYPPLPSDLPSPLFTQTEALREGEFSEVEEVSTPDGPRYRIVQVLARLPAGSARFAEHAATLEQQLEARPLSPLEFEAWMRIMEDRHQIRVLGMGTDDDGS